MSDVKKADDGEKREAVRAVRSAAGKIGMASRWGVRGKTRTVRAFREEADRLNAIGPTTADALRKVFEAVDRAGVEV